MMTRMNARFAGITLAMLSCLGPLAAAAATNIYHVVPKNAFSAFPFGTWETAATNIQDAVDAASAAYDPGATECVVLVTNGVYTPAGQITITNGITLRSVNGREGTIINGNMPFATNRCILIRDAVGRVTVDGFTVSNGYCYQQAAGGGVYVTNSQASILNCTITRNRSSGTASGLGNGGGIGVASSSGILITNCLISLNTNAPGILAHGAGVYIVQSKGLMSDCVVSGNQQTVNGSYGGGIYLVVPLASDFVVSNCVVAANHSHDVGGGIYVSGGTVTRCKILNNDSRNSAGGVILYSSTSLMTYSLIASNRANTAGGGVQMNNTSRMYNCEMLFNSAFSFGGGLHNSAGIVRNCLIAGNQAATNGGGVFWPANTTELSGCTIVRNYSGGIGGGIYVGVANANITNCIVYGNQASVTNNAGPHINALSYSCVPEITAGLKGNIAGNPLFEADGSGAGTNAVLGDYRLQTNSPCVGAGTNLGWMAVDPVVDLAGLPRLRPLWGRVDMGAYEAYPAAGALTNDFYALPVTGAAPLQVTFLGETSGNTNGLLYRWDFGDGEASAWSMDASATHTYAPSSTAYTVTLQTTNALGELAVRTRAAYVRVYPAIAYVSTNGLHLPPFETWEKAATNIQSAVNEAGAGFTTVLVSNGVYTVRNEIAITSAITLRSVSGDWNDTVICGAYPAVANRCLNVNAAGALVDGFTVTNGNIGVSQGGGIYLGAGIVQNCLIIGNKAVGGATPGAGAGVYIVAGAIVRNCEIRNNAANNDGGGVFNIGLLSDCIVEGNSSGANGGGIRIGGGTVERCVIIGNASTGTGNGGGGVSKGNSGGGVMRNCLIAGNSAKSYGGGFFMTAGSAFDLRNCTIAGNTAAGGGGVYFNNGLHQGVNCIVAFNEATGYGGAFDIGGPVAPSFTYSCSPDLAAGVNGNIGGDPLFLQPGSAGGIGFVPGNYRLAPGSPAIDSASAAGAPALDLDGADRPEDGDADGAAAYDMGAYEAGAGGEGDLRCGFAAPASRAAESLAAAFTAYAAGANTNGLFYFWDFGDGATSDWSAASRTVSHAYGYGMHSVTLGVSNELGQTAFHTRSDYIRVYPAHVHVATNGGSVSPYGSWGTAATNLQQAVDTAAEGYGYTLAVLVSGGVYTVGREITVTNPVTVRGFSGNRDDAVIRGGYPASTNRVFNLNHPGAIVEWVAITNGRVAGSTHGGGIYITAGTVRNCLVIGNSSPGYQGGGIYMMGGSVSNCAILNNSVGNIAGGGIAMQGAYQAVKNCLIAGNSAGTGMGGGVSIEGGYLDGCVISNNTARGAGGIYQRAGSISISNCVIVANTAAHTGGGVGFLPASGAGIFRNCLIAGNAAVSNGGGVAVASAAARFENCTIAGNSAGLGGGWHQTAAATGVNCIVYYNESTNASAPADLGGAFTNFIASCSPVLAGGVSNITAAPLFVRSGSGYGTNLVYGDYRLRLSSPAVDAGAPLGWMGNATDLAGDPRVQGDGPNMGAYEKVLGVPGVLFLIR